MYLILMFYHVTACYDVRRLCAFCSRLRLSLKSGGSSNCLSFVDSIYVDPSIFLLLGRFHLLSTRRLYSEIWQVKAAEHKLSR